ncbi:hypothetical protein [Escherichia coli]|uniref:hypothetical protein n=1 Tax=Escherichia coli TaxID=562 RepID=UPI000B412638|nr:hypothetical protein [Escherichia coli]EEZ6972684.1 hypothetical protein [Escherichia coli O9]EEC9594140.1 hypothetical protein [Escherichia coli]EFB0576324.1 hypothetical protein [Escherichia coli]EJE9930993.1 hypothetical protein [Escherichia coli]EJV1350321.1 hypothetical protein [Escherichia coli]
MLMTAIKSVFNFYMLCVQPLLGLFLVGYSIWSFSGDGICTAEVVDKLYAALDMQLKLIATVL